LSVTWPLPAGAVYPGEPVFEAVMDFFLGRYEAEATRGAVYLDAESEKPYLFYLGRVSLLRNPESSGGDPEIVEEQVVGVRRYADGRLERAPAHLLMTLMESSENPGFSEKPGFFEMAAQRGPVEAFLAEHLGLPMLEGRRREEEARLPEQRHSLRVAYNLRQAELMRQRRLLKERVERGVPAAGTKLRACEAELADLDRHRREAEAWLLSAPERLQLGPVSLYVQALILPVPPEEGDRRRDAQAEKVAMDLVRRREEAEGSVVEDVSDPHRKAGFDLKVLRADDSVRYVEVKGRSGTQAIEVTTNEWAQAANHRDRYWLYVVYHCDTTPTLYQVPDPFGCLLARQTGAMRISVSDIMGTVDGVSSVSS
jgi:hypothetical protein